MTKNPGPVFFGDFYGCGGAIVKIMGSLFVQYVALDLKIHDRVWKTGPGYVVEASFCRQSDPSTFVYG